MLPSTLVKYVLNYLNAVSEIPELQNYTDKVHNISELLKVCSTTKIPPSIELLICIFIRRIFGMGLQRELIRI